MQKCKTLPSEYIPPSVRTGRSRSEYTIMARLASELASYYGDASPRSRVPRGQEGGRPLLSLEPTDPMKSYIFDIAISWADNRILSVQARLAGMLRLEILIVHSDTVHVPSSALKWSPCSINELCMSPLVVSHSDVEERNCGLSVLRCLPPVWNTVRYLLSSSC